MEYETLKLTQEWDKTFPKSDKADHRKVTFHDRFGITLAADLCRLNSTTMDYIDEIRSAVLVVHGDKADSWFSHLAVEVPGQNCSNEWCEPVSDEEYGRL